MVIASLKPIPMLQILNSLYLYVRELRAVKRGRRKHYRSGTCINVFVERSSNPVCKNYPSFTVVSSKNNVGGNSRLVGAGPCLTRPEDTQECVKSKITNH